MPNYRIDDDGHLEFENFVEDAITHGLFGVQGHYNYDREFSPSSEGYDMYISLLQNMQVTNLRFPGGTTTERMFTSETFEQGNWLRSDAILANQHLEGNRFFLDDLAQAASDIGASISIVLPTRTAFEQSAAQAMIDGSFGERSSIREEYWIQLEAFVDEAILQAIEHGIEIETFEIGNEFWGGGEMSATEYGLLAGQIAIWLNEKLSTAEIDANISVQGISASATFSGRSGDFYLVEDGIGLNGEIDYRLFETLSSLEEHYQDLLFENGGLGDFPDYEIVSLAELDSYVDGVGSSVQIMHIADGLLAIENDAGETAADLIDGMILHPYFDAGYGDGSENSGIDSENWYAFNTIFQLFSNALDREDLHFHATEWSVRDVDFQGFEGLQNTIEAFFELVSNGVDFANYWPTTFGGTTPTDRVLIQTSEGDLTFAGVAFQLLSESVVGLSAVFDYDIYNTIDIHGFGNSIDTEGGRLVAFVGERSGQDQHDVEIDYGNFGIDTDVFVTVTSVGSDSLITTGSGGPIDIIAPSLEHLDGYMVLSVDGVTSLPTFDLDANGLVRVEITAITQGNDEVHGRGGNDCIETVGGDDLIYGGAGNDFINGGDGQDYIYGGEGDDTLHGGNNMDFIFAGEGNDTVWGGNGADIIELDSGNDTFFDSNLSGQWGEDTVRGGAGDDSIIGRGGDDVFFGDDGNDQLFGGDGNDILDGGSNDDILEGGEGNDTFVFLLESGNDQIIDFVQGEDQIDLSAWGVKSISDLDFFYLEDGVLLELDGESILLLGTTEDFKISKDDFVLDMQDDARLVYCWPDLM